MCLLLKRKYLLVLWYKWDEVICPNIYRMRSPLSTLSEQFVCWLEHFPSQPNIKSLPLTLLPQTQSPTSQPSLSLQPQTDNHQHYWYSSTTNATVFITSTTVTTMKTNNNNNIIIIIIIVSSLFSFRFHLHKVYWLIRLFESEGKNNEIEKADMLDLELRREYN